MDLTLMLASRGTVADIAARQAEGYIFDLKIDGVRVLARINYGDVELVSRSGVICTYQYPEVAGALRAAFPTGYWEIDGEIAVNDERGLPSWPLTHKRNAQVKHTSGWAAKMPATYYLFDLLTVRGIDIRHHSMVDRRRVLNQETLAAFARTKISTLQVVLNGYDGEAMWSVVKQYKLEGLVAKRPDSVYRRGRSSDWVKIKRTQTITCLVGGYDPGEGSRASTFGALHLYLCDEGKLTPIGKVGSGFSNQELRDVAQRLSQPPLVIEVSYLDVSPDGVLRQPVFQRVRTDVGAAECTIDQLKGA